MIELHLMGIPSMNSASDDPWYKRMKERKKWFTKVRLALGKSRPERPHSVARVSIVRASAGPEPDFDNLVQGGKWILDALVFYRVIEDDKPANFEGGAPKYTWQKAPRGNAEVVVKVEGVDE